MKGYIKKLRKKMNLLEVYQAGDLRQISFFFEREMRRSIGANEFELKALEMDRLWNFNKN